jgi:hypothetical protein
MPRMKRKMMLPTTKEIVKEGPVEMVPEQEAPEVHEVILVDVEPEMPQPRLYHALIRGYEESPPRMMDDLDDLDEWFSKDGSNDRD